MVERRREPQREDDQRREPERPAKPVDAAEQLVGRPGAQAEVADGHGVVVSATVGQPADQHSDQPHGELGVGKLRDGEAGGPPGLTDPPPPADHSGVTYAPAIPPSIRNVEAVMNDDSSEARKTTPLAISSGLPKRPIGMWT
ncbi:MAG: hypothetical protein QOF12_2789 [Solirubrobacteraceae bacterium]|nr:hypothetical protein [Solirubrobacteraceae bacterium]